jgi:tetratricopeptide (TPR) repeat protein
MIIFSLLFVSCYGIKSQNLFFTGLKYFNKGDYVKADSLFSIYLKESPNSIDAHYNYGVTRLYLGDTCTFCIEMYSIHNSVSNLEAKELYLRVCSSIDTVYYDKKYLQCAKGKERYTEIIESFKYHNYKTITVLDKYNYSKTHITYLSDFMHSEETDIIAIYRLYSDNRKVFLLTLTPPSYPGGDNAKAYFIDKNPLIEQGKTLFNISHANAYVEYVIDKNGNIKDINVTGVNSEIKQMDDFKKYIQLIISAMPKHTPAKFRGEKVDYLVGDRISFW